MTKPVPPQRTFARSIELHRQALELIPGGVSSNARLWHKSCTPGHPCTIFVKGANGAHITDVDDNEYIDYRLGFGPIILGHSYPAVHAEVDSHDEHGIIFALPHEQEIRVARFIRDALPSAEFVRFANSGTEATMAAVRIARAFTGRDKVLKFEGAYHGSHDYVLFSTDPPFDEVGPPSNPIAVPKGLGIPKSIADLVVVNRFNQADQVEATMEKHGHQIACIIVEPVMGNATVIPPEPGFLQRLRKLCDRHGAVLIFDEVKTGFRIGPGGAQVLYGVTPDLSAIAKAMGNGYPVAAVVGKKHIMEEIGPGRVVHGGTYSANHLSLTATEATLRVLREKPVFEHLERFGRKLMSGISDVLADRKLAHVVQGHPAMFQFMLSKEPVREYRDLANIDMETFKKIQVELLQRGVMLDEDNEEPMFTCFSHNNDDLERTLEALDESVRTVLA